MATLLGKKSTNGVKLLLEQIQKLRPDMPPEFKDDMTFGALVVLHELGMCRDTRISRLEKISGLLVFANALVWVTIVAVSESIPWLTELFKKIFSP